MGIINRAIIQEKVSQGYRSTCSKEKVNLKGI